MKAIRAPHELGQSIWLDNITLDLLDSGTLQRYIDEWSVFCTDDVQHASIKRVSSAVSEGIPAIAFVHQYLAIEG